MNETKNTTPDVITEHLNNACGRVTNPWEATCNAYANAISHLLIKLHESNMLLIKHDIIDYQDYQDPTPKVLEIMTKSIRDHE